MINQREPEIRNESLELVVEAYRIVNLLPPHVDQKIKNQLLDDSFHVSSGVAEAFRTAQNIQSEQDLDRILCKLLGIKDLILLLEKNYGFVNDETDLFMNVLEQLHVELVELLAGIKLINTDLFTPKLDSACI